MPAKSAKQQRYMGMCLSKQKKGCPPKRIARKYARKKKG